MKDRSNVLLSIVFIVAVMVFTITLSIALPIYVRPFYYAHVDALDLADNYGMEREEVIEAYDEVLDFLTLDGREFGTGVLPFSEEGKGHFEDCRVLFDLNKNALLISLALIVFLMTADKIGAIRLARVGDLPLGFFAGVATLALIAVLAVVVAQDFHSAFTVFHKIFFPGKDNWMFNPYTDPIILFMPIEFFRDCAILIGSSILLISTFLIAKGIIKKRLG